MIRITGRKNRQRASSLLLAALGAAAVLGPPVARAEAVARTTPPNIIIYLVDTLRRDHLGIYGYSRDPAPRLTQFAADAVRFDDAFSPSSWTRPAVASLLSGTYPAQHGARTRLDKIAPGIELIGEYLRAAGYQSAAFVSNVNVIPLWGFDRGFDRFVDVDLDRRSDAVNEVVFQYLAGNPSEPFLLYIHTRDPHLPNDPPPPYDRMWPEEPPADATSRPHGRRPYGFSEAIRNYDGEVSYNDEQFGRLLDRLKADGSYRDSLIVFTADHGEEFYEHGVWGHGQSLFGELVRIPLLIKFPDNRHGGRAVAQRASLIDLLPTLLASAGLAVPDHLAGVDLLPAIERGEDPKLDTRPLFFDLDLVGANRRRTVSTGVARGPFKYTVRTQPYDEVSLWNLELDALETTNLESELPEIRAALADELQSYRNSDHSGVHFWVRGSGDKREVAKGTLHSTGRFERVRFPSQEADDRVEIRDEDHRLTFELVLDGSAALPDRDGIVFDVFPTDSPIVIEEFVVEGESAPVALGREAAPAGELPFTLDRESPVIRIDHPDELFAPARPATSGATAHAGFVNRSQGELSDLKDPIVERLKALGYVE